MTGLVNLQITISNGAELFYGKKHLKALMRKVGGEIAALARALVRRSSGTGRTYRGSGGSRYRPYKPGHYQASSPGQPPVSVTGQLAQSIKVRPFRSGEGVAIRDTMFYALFLEKGAQGGGRKGGLRGKAGARTGRVLLPRPFLTAALDQREASISTRVKAAVMQDIEFRRIKP